MSHAVAMRSSYDRLRYVVSFEVTLLLLLLPLGAVVFDQHLADIGVLGLILTSKAMVVNYFYNLAFDRVYASTSRTASERGIVSRLIHSAGLEAMLLVTSMPLLMWWLDLKFVQAVMTDLAVTSIVILFTFFFTLVYDRIYPVQ